MSGFKKGKPSKFLGQVRQSKLTQNFGPGAIVDFVLPGTQQLFSGVVGCLEDWDDCAPRGRKGMRHPQILHEPKLQAHCQVKGFRLPPVRPERSGSDDDTLPVYLFPTWLQCPKCSKLMPHHRWKRSDNPSEVGYFCSNPSCKQARDKPQPVIPVWLVTACADGHLDDFPWQKWIGCTCSIARVSLEVEQRGAGLAGKFVRCTNPKCAGRKGRSLRDAFKPQAFQQVQPRCTGRSPHLGRRDSGTSCSCRPHVVQRNASNVYWGATASALHIPSLSEQARGVLDQFHENFAGTPQGEWPGFVKFLQLEEKTGLSTSEIVEHYAGAVSDQHSIEDQEYRMLMSATTSMIRERDLVAQAGTVPGMLRSHIGDLVLVPRLKEINVLRGFTRIKPPTGAFADSAANWAFLSRRPLDWLPATVSRGEGIFLSLDADRLHAWEERPSVRERMKLLEDKVVAAGESPDSIPPARWVMLHTLSHVLIKTLAQRSGYSLSALTERIYAKREQDTCGVLLYTGSADANGTLGGLVRQGREELFRELVMDALMDARWCSSDPLCVMEPDVLSGPNNLAACHACVLLSESSCQHFNQWLDRALLVGTPDDAACGFFSDLFF